MKTLFLLFFVQFSFAVSIVSTKVGATQIDLGSSMRFDVAFFVATTDEQLLLNGIPITDLPLGTAPQQPQLRKRQEAGAGREEELAMPQAMMMLAGTSELVCACPTCPDSDDCVSGTCTFGSLSVSTQNGPPAAFMPMAAIEETTAQLFSVFAGTFDPATVVKAPNTYMGIKILRNFQEWSNSWQDYVPQQLDIKQCRLRLVDHALSTNSSGPVAGVLGPLPTDYAPLCDPLSLATLISEMSAAIDEIAPEGGAADSSRRAMERRTFNVGSFQQRDAWLGCSKLLESFVTKGPVQKTLRGSKRCFETPNSAAWLADPCCNHALLFEQCCAPRPLTVTVEGVTATDSGAISAACTNADRSTALLSAYVKSLQNAESCDAMARDMGASWQVTQDLMRFVDTCHEEIYGKNGPPTCLSDENCYTSCDKQRGQCVIPYDNPDPYLLECFTDHIDPLLDRMWRKQWGLTGQSTTEEFKTAFQTHLYDEKCVGPTSWQYNEQWKSDLVANCDGLPHDNCWCYSFGNDTQCWHNYMQAPNQTACVAEKQCNWDTSLDETACTAPADTQFCGQCHAGQCWPVTEQTMCYTWVEDPAHCTNIGGVQGEWGPWHCVFPSLTTEEECIPADLCGGRQDISVAGSYDDALGERWCSPLCVATLKTTEELCVGQDVWWNTDKNLCQVHAWKQECLDHPVGNTTWFSGRQFRPGRFTTQGQCDEGRCSVDHRMTAAQCAAYASCTKPCAVCRPRDWDKKLCHNDGHDQSSCEANDGTWDITHNTCIYDQFRTQADCQGQGHTFEQCESLSLDTCANGGTLSTVGKAHLQCWVNQWDQCSTQAKCEATGDCDDWDFQNWFRSDCWSDLNKAKTDASCLGVCLIPFDTSKGYPQCDWNAGSIGWSRIGCINYDVVNTTACTSLGGVWKQRAFDEASCNAHGYGCDQRSFWQLTPKQGSDCVGCGGQIRPYYKYHRGVWLTGEMEPLTWTTRQFASINTWQPTLNWTKLWTEVEKVSAQVIAKAIKSQMQCKHQLVATHMQVLACDCAPGTTDTTCFDGVEMVSVGQQEVFSGLSSQMEWANVVIHVSEGAIPAEQDYDTVSASTTSDLSLLLGTQTEGRRRMLRKRVPQKRSPYAPDEYEVVTNHADYVVGRLLGSGVAITVPQNLSEPLWVCLVLDEDIPVDPESIYPTPDWAGYNASEPKWWPLDLDIVVAGDDVQYCANVTESGTFFPIRRLNGWETATGIATSVPTAQPTLNPTAEPTAEGSVAPTVSTTAQPSVSPTAAPTVDSSLSTGAVIGISVGAVLVVVIILAAICMGMRNGPPTRPSYTTPGVGKIYQYMPQRNVLTRKYK